MNTATQDRTIVKGAYTFDEKNHVHTLDGKPLTGVTTILGVIAKPMLIQWAANQAVEYIKEKALKTGAGMYEASGPLLEEARTAHRKKKESAGEFGTNVHSAIEKWINAQMLGVQVEIKLDGMEKKAFDHFVKWATDNKVKFLESEKHVYSREWWSGGIADMVCEIDGKRFIGDIKTGRSIYRESFFQGSAYAKMAIEMGLYEKFDGIVIINLKKDGGFEYEYNFDVEGNKKAFEAALYLYRQLNAISR